MNINSLLPRTGNAVVQSKRNSLKIDNATIRDSVKANFPAMANLVDISVSGFYLYVHFKKGHFTGTPRAGFLGTSNSPLRSFRSSDPKYIFKLLPLRQPWIRVEKVCNE